MTKPTGRPRGRPKTKEYVTLMARVPQELADRVKRYAAAHHQPISVVMRDALLLLMDEYPSSADLSAPHRIAAHEFLSNRYESALDTLLGETDSTGLDELLSDTNEETIETLMFGVNSESDIVSDAKSDDAYIMSDKKEAQTDIQSDMNGETSKTRAVTAPQGRSVIVSGAKAARQEILSDAKADVPPFMSDTKGDDRTSDVQETLPGMMSDRKAATPASTLVPAILSDTNVPAFDTTKYVLGKLCPRGHDYHGTGRSLRRLPRAVCLQCDAEWARERRQTKRQATQR